MSYLFDSFFTFLLNFLSFLFTNRCSFLFWELIPYHYAFFFFFKLGAAPLSLRLCSRPASQPRAASPGYSVAQPGAGHLQPTSTCEAPWVQCPVCTEDLKIWRSADQHSQKTGQAEREGRSSWEGLECNPTMFFIFHVFLKTCGYL